MEFAFAAVLLVTGIALLSLHRSEPRPASRPSPPPPTLRRAFALALFYGLMGTTFAEIKSYFRTPDHVWTASAWKEVASHGGVVFTGAALAGVITILVARYRRTT